MTPTLCVEPRVAEEISALASWPSHLLDQLTDPQRQQWNLIPPRVEYVWHASFDEEESSLPFLEPSAAGPQVPIWSPDETAEIKLAIAKMLRLAPAQERALFLRLNYARYRLCRLLALKGHERTLEKAREVLRWHGLAQASRSMLVRSHLGLVYAMSKHAYTSGVDFHELISEGNMALLRCVEKFNVDFGARFSTYACRSILKSFGRLSGRLQRQQKRFPMQYSANLDHAGAIRDRQDDQRDDLLDTLREILGGNLASLTAVERTIVTERFALDGRDGKRTLAQVAETVGLTDERVRQLQILALSKIRTAMERYWPARMTGV